MESYKKCEPCIIIEGPLWTLINVIAFEVVLIYSSYIIKNLVGQNKALSPAVQY